MLGFFFLPLAAFIHAKYGYYRKKGEKKSQKTLIFKQKSRFVNPAYDTGESDGNLYGQ